MDSRYTNRELSLLDFQERVLAIAENPNVPLLERVKFVAIVASNLDEFFQVRVAALREQVAAGVSEVTGAASPSALLASIRRRCLALAGRTERLVADQIIPGLAEHGIHLSAWEDLDEEERDTAYQVFERDVYPMLTPLGFDPAHPFPFISNLSMNLAVTLHDPAAGESRFARVKVPPLLPRFLEVGSLGRLVPMEQVIAAHLPTLFPGMDIVGHYAFRVTRSAEQEVAEAEAYDLLEAMKEMLHTRHRFSPRGASRGAGRDAVRRARPPDRATGPRRFRGLPGPRAARPGRLLRHPRPRPSRAEGAGLLRHHPAGAGRPRRRLHLRAHPAPRPAGASPLRVLHHFSRSLPGRSLTRPRRGGHQADPLPHLVA